MIALLTLILAGSAVHGATDTQADDRARTPPLRSAQSFAHADDQMQKHSDNSAVPAAALLEYLGEFDDAADGLDAMGLAEDETTKDGAPQKRERQ